MFVILNTIFKTFSNIAFIFDIASSFLYEYFIFLIKKDYIKFIRNVASNLSQKNILYVKMFQAISLNNNLIDGAMNAELLKYTDSAPYSDDDLDEGLFDEIVRKFYLRPSNDTIPINSGMISLVYKMLTVDNDYVIIKIKRKNIDEKLEDAIEKLLFFIKIVSYIPQFNMLDIPNVVQKNISLLRQQLDFNEEVKNTIEMAENCKNLKYIKVPQVYENVTKMYPEVIMMEFIKGTGILKLDESEYNEYAKLVLKYGFVSIINNSVTHGDMHAGNIIFIKNEKEPVYQLGLIDFGIVTRINKNTTNLFLDVVSNLFTDSSAVLAEKILNNIIEPKEVFMHIPFTHKNMIINEASNIIEETIHGTKNASQLKLYEFIKKFNEYLCDNKLSSYGLYISDDFVKLQMALAMSQGVSLCLCKNDFMPFANTVLNELFHTDLLMDT